MALVGCKKQAEANTLFFKQAARADYLPRRRLPRPFAGYSLLVQLQQEQAGSLLLDVLQLQLLLPL